MATNIETNDSHMIERRAVERAILSHSTRLRPNEWSSLEVRMVDISNQGFRAECDAALKIGGYVRLDVPGLGAVEARVIWRQHGEFGARFIHPIDLRHCAWTNEAIVPQAVDEGLSPSETRVAELLAQRAAMVADSDRANEA